MAEMEIQTYTGGVASTNAYLVKANGGHLAIDAPEGFWGYLKSNVETLLGLVLTHGHYDHIWDASKIIHQFGCPVYYHKADLVMFKNPDIMSGFGLPPGLINPVDVTHALGHDDSLSLSPWNFKVIHAPGHSPGSICFYEASQHILFGGDVLFAGSIGRTDFPGCSHDELIGHIKNKILTLPAKTVVYPGHGPSTSVEVEKNTNPFL
ncbi:MAG: MBL fold metallo-hydrolase [Verrucomicrobiota bacterium]